MSLSVVLFVSKNVSALTSPIVRPRSSIVKVTSASRPLSASTWRRRSRSAESSLNSVCAAARSTSAKSSPFSSTSSGGTTTPVVASISSDGSCPKPVAREALRASNFSWSTVDMANSTMNMHISTVTMSM